MRTALGKQQGIAEELIAHVQQSYHEGPFIARESIALHLAELLVLAPQSVDAAFCAELYRYFILIQVVQLGIATVIFFGLGRFAAAFRVPLQGEIQAC